jgi:hypothetical protein
MEMIWVETIANITEMRAMGGTIAAIGSEKSQLM